MRRLAGAAAIVVGCALLGLHAQDAPQQPVPTFRAGVDVVQLDVSVLDASRRPVRGLTAADFRVVENGVAQPIVAFEAVDIPDAASLRAPWMREASVDLVTNDASARRIVVIVIDDAHIGLDPWNIRTVQHIAHDVIDRLGPEDFAAVTFTDMGKRQDITNDRALLSTAVDSFVPHPSTRIVPLGPSAARPSGGSLQSQIDGGRFGSPCSFRGKIRSTAACVLDTFLTAGEALKAAPPGRKTLVYISAGPVFDLSMTDLRGGAPPPGEEVSGIQAVLRSFHEANITVYAVDPTGVSPTGIMAPRLDTLRMFAEETGGRATIDTNSPWQDVPQIFRENGSYYLLGVRSSGGADAEKFHKVRVTIDRPGVEVRARSGYYAPAPGEAAVPAGASTLDDALGQVVPGGALPLGVTVAPFAVPGGREAALAIVTALREPLEPASRELELGVVALDADCGGCRALPSDRQTFRLSPLASAGLRTEFLSRLPLPPGRYEIRVAAALDGRAGGVLTHVEIPDYRKNRLSASGLVLTTADSVATARADVMSDVMPVVPAALREFDTNDAVTAFLRIYQGGSRAPGPVRVNATILDETGRTVADPTTFLDAAKFASGRSADYELNLAIPTLELGMHLLTIEVHLGKDVVTRQATFLVR